MRRLAVDQRESNCGGTLLTAPRHRWGVILAGGEGTRLRPLTQLICGDDRPKQFCPLFGGATLLDLTRRRAARSIRDDQILVVLTSAHEQFYIHDLAHVPVSRQVVQPSNRGTAPALLYSLLRVHRMDPTATVACLPSDHYYSDDGKFSEALDTAFDFAESNSPSVVLLGARPARPEVEYGWIEPGAPWPGYYPQLSHVKTFWEKPCLDLARILMGRACLWNTFVMVGRVTAFLEVLTAAVPQLWQAFHPIMSSGEQDPRAVQVLYDRLSSIDFSTCVLAEAAGWFTVLPLGEVEWGDLGNPKRAVATLCRSGVDMPWIRAWCHANPWIVAEVRSMGARDNPSIQCENPL
jgi:mannose-1-phosphate guanylyltransferase